MKTIKLTKKMLQMHPADLLVKLGAVNLTKKRAYPSEVYFSQADNKKLLKNLEKRANKKLKGCSKKAIEYSVNMDWLNYGPNSGLEEVLKSGWAVVDTGTIDKDKE
jgi:diphthamide synthase subunit DPH2